MPRWPKKEEVKETVEEKEDKMILVQAVGKIGFYGDERRYPIGNPKSKPFWIKESEFSDGSKDILVKGKKIGLMGWMKKVGTGEEVNPGPAKKKTPADLFKEAVKEVNIPQPAPKPAVPEVSREVV